MAAQHHAGLPAAVVVDASVTMKWLLAEFDSDLAIQLIEAAAAKSVRLIAPELLWLEMGNVLWRSERRGDLTTDDVETATAEASRLPIRVVSSEWLWRPALECARTTGASVYDSSYVALAAATGVPFVTADTALVRSLAGGSYEGIAVPLRDWTSEF